VSSSFPPWGPLIWPVLAVLGAGVQIGLTHRPRNTAVVLEMFLVWWFALGVGVTALVAFVSLAFAPDQIAAQIGFPPGNPFQFEVACANLALGVLGVLCIRYRDEFWNATAIAATVFLFGASYGHIHQYADHGNDQPYNIGPILWTDIGVQVVLVVALVAHRSIRRRAVSPDGLDARAPSTA